MESKSKLWNVMGSGFFLVVSVIAIVALVMAFSKDYKKKMELDSEIKAWQEKISLLEKKNTELNSLINYYTSEEFVEKEARLRLNLKKPGEQVVILPALVNNDDKFGGDSEDIKSNWVKWWNYFFNN